MTLDSEIPYRPENDVAFDVQSRSDFLRQILLSGAIILVIFAVLGQAIANFHILHSTGQLIFAVFCFGLYYLTPRYIPHSIAVRVFVCVLTVFLYFFVYLSGGIQSTSNYWLLLVPIIALKGHSLKWGVGAFSSIVLFYVVESLMHIHGAYIPPFQGPTEFIGIRFLAQYIGIAAFIFLAIMAYEKSRLAAMHRTLTYAKQLEEQKITLAQQAEEISHINQDLNKRNAELAELIRDKDEFLGITSHDLKNPLAGVRLASERIAMLCENPNQQNIDKVRNAAEQIQKECDRMIAITSSLLTSHAIDSSLGVKHLVECNVSSVAQESIASVREHALSKQITITEEIEPAAFICTDVEMLRTVFDNLLSNAVKYSPQGGMIHCRVARNPETGAVQFSVRDEGAGIDKNEQQNLFQKFSRLSTKPTGGEVSTGLGLYIVKKVVDSLKGNVRCESVVGKGSTFFAEFKSASM